MASLNKVILIGHLGRDPESRTFPSGDSITNVTLATTETWKDKQSGEKREATEWHRVVFSGKLSEIANQYLRKGSLVYVEGSIRTRKYQDKDGVEKYATDIRADQMKMLGGKPEGAASPAQRPASPRSSGGGFDDSDDVPFNRAAPGRSFLAV